MDHTNSSARQAHLTRGDASGPPGQRPPQNCRCERRITRAQSAKQAALYHFYNPSPQQEAIQPQEYPVTQVDNWSHIPIQTLSLIHLSLTNPEAQLRALAGLSISWGLVFELLRVLVNIENNKVELYSIKLNLFLQPGFFWEIIVPENSMGFTQSIWI